MLENKELPQLPLCRDYVSGRMVVRDILRIPRFLASKQNRVKINEVVMSTSQRESPISAVELKSFDRKVDTFFIREGGCVGIISRNDQCKIYDHLKFHTKLEDRYCEFGDELVQRSVLQSSRAETIVSLFLSEKYDKLLVQTKWGCSYWKLP